MARNTALLLSFIVLLALITSGTAAYFLLKGECFTVTFNNSKNLKAGSNVYLAGIDIGDVRDVKFSSGKVNVIIQISSDYKGKIPRNTMFFIGTDYYDTNKKCILAKSLNHIDSPIHDGDVLIGTDSLLVWKLSETADHFRDIINSPQAQNYIRKLEQIADELNEELKKIDWDQLGKDLSAEIQVMLLELERLMRSDEVQEGIQEIKKKITSIEHALKKAKNSEEARRLEKALEDFYKRTADEYNKAKRSHTQ